jgi:GTP-binding protein EngB required for normal cell division
MKHPLEQLQSDLNRFNLFLEKDDLLSFSPEEKQILRSKGHALRRKLENIESSYLTVGLVGGTGVGKSTIMNALAGSEIASASHRRPHTDKVLIYRHIQTNPLSTLFFKNVPWHEITHQVDEVMQILICDLPDFDSIVDEHKQHVVNFMENLDILVWVTSPEKYADQRFYEFLWSVPKAEQNFYFVLNKTDLLFQEEDLESAYRDLESIVKSFQKHIVDNGPESPLIFTLSAEQARQKNTGSPWNQFPTFKREIFQQRDFKQISAIKAANLDVEIGQLLLSSEKELSNLEAFQQILDKSINEFNDQIPLWIEAGQESVDFWIQEFVKPRFQWVQRDPKPLVGPTYGVAHVLGIWQQRFSPSTRLLSNDYRIDLPQDIAVSFERRFEWLKERLGQRILSENLPAAFGQTTDEILDSRKSMDDLKERFLYIAASRISEPRAPALIGFKAMQHMAYGMLFVLFLIGIGGGVAWQKVIDVPGVSTILHLILSVIQTIFSTRGLAALGSYIILNILLAFHFYRRYEKRLESVSQKISKALKMELVNVWQDELKHIHENLETFKARVESQKSAILSMGSTKKDINPKQITDNQ